MQTDKLFIEELSKLFVKNNKHAINKICKRINHNNYKLSKLAAEETIYQEINKILQSIVDNKKHIEDIKSYIFSCLNNLTKNINIENKNKVYICPGCKYNSKFEIIDFSIDKLVCYSCKDAIISAKDKSEENFYKAFSEHNLKGFRCPECNNFIPDTEDRNISCIYPNCSFAGEVTTLKIMPHPTIKVNIEIPMIIDFVDNKTSDADAMMKEDINSYIKILNESIEYEINNVKEKSHRSTLINKLCMCNAIKNIIEKYPNDMISYFIFLNRDIGIQHKIFQEFTKLVEDRLPGSTILDIFDGISEFNAVVNEKHEIINLTSEKYIVANKYRTYFIGKVLEIINSDKKQLITNSIKEYSFNKIVMNENIEIGTKVDVRHLRLTPHYQMGALNSLNRIRRSIVDRAYFLLNGKDRI